MRCVGLTRMHAGSLSLVGCIPTLRMLMVSRASSCVSVSVSVSVSVHNPDVWSQVVHAGTPNVQRGDDAKYRGIQVGMRVHSQQYNCDGTVAFVGLHRTKVGMCDGGV